jgi:hypothetical protein
MCAKHNHRREPGAPDLVPDPDAAPSMEYLLAEADLNYEVERFGIYVDKWREREISDRDSAEDLLNIIDGWTIRIEKVEENPEQSKLGDVELFDRTGGDKDADVVPVAVIRSWLVRGDNLERLMAFRDALDEERFDLPYAKQPTRNPTRETPTD